MVKSQLQREFGSNLVVEKEIRSMSKIKHRVREWGENSNGKVEMMRTLAGNVADYDTVMLINQSEVLTRDGI